MSEERLMELVMPVFQQYGFEGTSLTRISEATGLGRASIYHRFPEGKTQIADRVLERAESWLTEHALEPLGEKGNPRDRIEEMGKRLTAFYKGGKRSCLVDVLSLGDLDGPLRKRIRTAVRSWVSALAAVLSEEGFPEATAAKRAEDAVIRIQGSLVVSRALRDPAPFKRTIDELGDVLLGGSTSPRK